MTLINSELERWRCTDMGLNSADYVVVLKKDLEELEASVDKQVTQARMNEVGMIDMGDVEYPRKRLATLKATHTKEDKERK